MTTLLPNPMKAASTICLSPDPIPGGNHPFAVEEGAEAQFLGVVRGTEEGRPIAGIDYTSYAPMAEKMLQELVAQAVEAHGSHDVLLQHRTGFVPAGEPSIVIRVRTRHSALSFTLCQWYLREIKTRVPVWKRIVHASPTDSDA